ncbi:MAG: pyruvate kinase, partial [Lachnospiraceae bacterium]|nr:pyruvate kinase [Lachnospiraceae bacterium]
KAVAMPKPGPGEVFLSSSGNFMGGNARLPLEYVVFVRAREYLELDERGKYQVARLVGMLNQKLKPHSAALVGPGRWGTTTPSLGVPVHFSELSNMTALCEVSYQQGGLMPELSFGSHFFLDIVEAGIFYVAVFVGKEGVKFYPEYILDGENLFGEFLESESEWGRVIHLARTEKLFLFSDITTQKVLVSRG